MESWLRGSGAVGLENLELADFPITGRGVKTRRHFKQGETILTIPHSTLWTAEHAYADPTFGPVIRSISPPPICRRCLGRSSPLCPIAQVGIRRPAKACSSAARELLFKHLLFPGRAGGLRRNFAVHHHEAAGAAHRGRLQVVDRASAWTESRPPPTR